MPRPRTTALDALNKIVTERQPLSLRDVRYFARCYVDMMEWDKDHMYQVIRDNFDVNEENKVTLRVRDETN